MTNTQKTLKVWDPLIRIGHWTLVTAFFTAYLTEDELTFHVWAGYVVAAYLPLRILWGFTGGKYAKFSSFVYSPARIIAYLQNLLNRTPQHYIGHNPAGGAMVIALLVCLTATTLTGMKLYAVADNKGPFALSANPDASQIQSTALVSVAQAENNTPKAAESAAIDKQAENFWKELHELFTNLTLLLVFLHISGVAVSSYIDKEKLVKAMLTGNKDIDDTYQ